MRDEVRKRSELSIFLFIHPSSLRSISIKLMLRATAKHELNVFFEGLAELKMVSR